MNGKTLLAAACAISLACGYIAGKAGSPSWWENEATSAAQTRPDRTHARETRRRAAGDNALLDSILGGRPIGEIPAAELAALIARLSKDDPSMDPLSRAKRAYQLQLLVAKLPARQIEEAVSAIHTDPAVYTAEGLNSVLSALARNDPDRAATLLRRLLVEGSSPSDLRTATYDIGRAMAALGMDQALAFIDSLPSGPQDSIIYGVISSVPENERIGMLDEIHRRKGDGRLMLMPLESYFNIVLSTDAPVAKEWLSKLPEGAEKTALRLNAVLTLYQSGDTDAATEWMRDALAADPGREKETFERLMEEILFKSPQGIAHLARLLPEGVGYTAGELEPTASYVFRSGSGYVGLISLAGVLRDPHEQALLISRTIGKAASAENPNERLSPIDLETLTHGINRLGLTGEDATLVNNALETLRNPPPPPAD